MPQCTECKYEGKYYILPVPYPIEMMIGMKLGMPGNVNVTLIGFEEEARKRGFTKDDLSKKGMRCQAPGGGPTKDPIVLIQSMIDQPCSFFVPKDKSIKSSVPAPAAPLQSAPKPMPSRITASSKSPFLAALLSYFLLGGAGQIYLGQWKKGLALMISTFFLSFIFVGILIPIIGIGDAYGIAQKLNNGNSVEEWEFNINWKASGLVLIIYSITICVIVFLVSLVSSR